MTATKWFKRQAVVTRITTAISGLILQLIVAGMLSSCAHLQGDGNGSSASLKTTHRPYTKQEVVKAEILREKEINNAIFIDESVLAHATPGNTSVHLYIAQQRGELYVGDIVAMRFPIATGRPGYTTPTGNFSIMSKERFHRSSAYGTVYDSSGSVVRGAGSSGTVPRGGRFVGADMPYFMRLTSYGVGMHQGYIPYPFAPASHGCIRLPDTIAPRIYEFTRVGTPVRIVSS